MVNELPRSVRYKHNFIIFYCTYHYVYMLSKDKPSMNTCIARVSRVMCHYTSVISSSHKRVLINVSCTFVHMDIHTRITLYRYIPYNGKIFGE